MAFQGRLLWVGMAEQGMGFRRSSLGKLVSPSMALLGRLKELGNYFVVLCNLVLDSKWQDFHGWPRTAVGCIRYHCTSDRVHYVCIHHVAESKNWPINICIQVIAILANYFRYIGRWRAAVRSIVRCWYDSQHSSQNDDLVVKRRAWGIDP